MEKAFTCLFEPDPQAWKRGKKSVSKAWDEYLKAIRKIHYKYPDVKFYMYAIYFWLEWVELIAEEKGLEDHRNPPQAPRCEVLVLRKLRLIFK